MRRVERAVWVLLVGVVLPFTACVAGSKYQKPACQQVYDECTDQCAPVCEQHQTSALDPEEALYDSSQGVCADCVERCKKRADACDMTP